MESWFPKPIALMPRSLVALLELLDLQLSPRPQLPAVQRVTQQYHHRERELRQREHHRCRHIAEQHQRERHGTLAEGRNCVHRHSDAKLQLHAGHEVQRLAAQLDQRRQAVHEHGMPVLGIGQSEAAGGCETARQRGDNDAKWQGQGAQEEDPADIVRASLVLIAILTGRRDPAEGDQ